MKWLLAFICTVSLGAGSVAAPGHGNTSDEAVFRRWLAEYLRFEYHDEIQPPFDPADKKYWRYSVAMVDLNGDRKPEAIVHVVGPSCGTEGCGVEVFAERNAGWLPILDSGGWAPIRVLQTKSHGWSDLGVCVRGGGVDPPYEAIFHFDGEYYSDFLDTPAPRDTRGTVVIGDATTPLFTEKAERGVPMSGVFGPQEFRNSNPTHC